MRKHLWREETSVINFWTSAKNLFQKDGKTQIEHWPSFQVDKWAKNL